MKWIVLGAHLRREDIEPEADALPAAGLWLSGVPVADDVQLAGRELLLRVASVRQSLLEKATFIAIRYGLAVTSAEAAREKCAIHLTRWRELLQRHQGECEVLLKTAAANPLPRPDRKNFENGADYLRALHEASRAAEPDPKLRAAVDELLIPMSTHHRWVRRDGKSLELALLVPREHIGAVQQAGDQLRARAAGVPFLLSGPWPLEVFADDDHE
jgi:hypothetical protein